MLPSTLQVRHIGLIIALLLAFLIGITEPFQGLAPQGQRMLAVTLAGFAFWIFRPPEVPYFAGGAIILAGALILKIPLDVVTSGYTSSATWVLIPSLFFGFALVKTGLGQRISYAVLKSFRPTYGNICVSWFIIGVFLSALTPSITVRLAIVMPIALSLVEACRITDRSEGSALICFAAYAAVLLPGTGWQTGSLWGIFMMGFYPPEMKSLVTAGVWFRYMAGPWFGITVLYMTMLYIVFRPAQPLNLERNTFQKQYEGLGKITRQEIGCAVVLSMTLILFSTEKWTGIKTPEAALMGLVALMLLGIISLSDIGTGVNWDIINFFGVVIGLTPIFAAAGIADWAQPIIEPGILSLAGSPLTLLLALTILLWGIRFIDVPWGFTTFAILAPVFVPLYQQYGIHPALVSVAFIAAGNSGFMAYQQPFIMVSNSITQSRCWSNKQVAISGVLYAVAIIAGILLSSFYWKGLGLM